MAYTRLRYIESNGTQYIDTGVIPQSENFRVKCKFSISELSTTSVLFGGGDNSTVIISIMAQNPAKIYVGGGRIISNTVYFTVGGVHEMDCHANNGAFSMIFDGNTYSEEYVSTINKEYPLFLFGNNKSGTAKGLCKAKVYSFQIYDNGTLVRDFVPVMDGNGACGLYDNVNGVFYKSASGVDFDGVRESDGLPVGSTPCLYIESDGTQYIDTGVVGKTGIKTELDFSVKEVGVSIPLGCYSPQRCYLVNITDTGLLRYGYVDWVESSKSVIGGQRYHIVTDLSSGSQTMSVNGEVVASSSISTDYENSYTMYAFAYNDGGTAGDFSKIRMNSLKIYDNGVLVRDYVPLYYNGSYGLWDMVNGVFCTSASSTSFTGLKSDFDGNPLYFEECEYIESFGEEYIDTLFKPTSDALRIEYDFEYTGEHGSTSLYGSESSSSPKYSICPWGANPEFYVGNSTQLLPLSTSLNTRYLLNVEANNGNLGVSLNGISQSAIYTGELQKAYNIYLFANNINGSALQISKQRLYGCKIYDNGDLVRDFTPCQIGREYGLWDKANCIYYTTPVGAFTGKWKENKILPMSLQAFRQRMLGLIKGELPNGYQLCEYIQSDGTNYIDTGFKPNQDTRLVVDFQAIGWSKTDVCMFVGVSKSPMFMFGKESTSDWRTGIYYNTSEAVHTRHAQGDWDVRNVLDWNKNVVTWRGVSVSVTPATFQCSYSAYLFACNGGEGKVSYLTKGRIYSYQIYDNNILVQDCVPCVNNEGIFGMYDKVNGVFYYSQTSSQFTGKLKNPNDYYQFPSSLTLDGSALIDTGYKPNQNTKIVADFNIETYSDQSALFGVRQSGASFLAFTGDNNVGYQVDLGSLSNDGVGSGYASAGRCQFQIYVSGTTATMKTGSSTITFGNVSNFQSTYAMYIGTINDNGSPMFQNPFRGEIYSFQIYEGNVLIRDFVPAIDPMGESGLYDRVNGSFHKANMVGLPDGYAYVDGVYTNGNAYINTGVNPTNNTRVILDVQIEASSSQQAIFGSSQAHSVNSFLLFTGTGSTGWKFDYGNQASTNTNGSHDGRMLIDMNKNVLSVNGVVNDTRTTNTFTSSYPMYLCQILNGNSVMTSYPFVGKIYSCKIYDNGILVRDYITCKNLSTGRQGLYDKANNTFNVSIGSSNFGDPKIMYKADFTYTGSIHSVTLSNGSYKLEVWGAQGGSSYASGGKGGYSVGVLNISSPTTLYICVGGKGSKCTNYTSYNTYAGGGYNGGGNAGYNGCGGGGATHIATATGILRDMYQTSSTVLIVAGGGGGAGASNSTYPNHYGGYGGGTSGGSGGKTSGFTISAGSGGSQSNGGSGGTSGAYAGVSGSFGLGGNSAERTRSNSSYYSSGAGGGGWYGGGGGAQGYSDYSGYNGYLPGGGGGSGYVNSKLTSASTIAGNTSFPSISGGTETGHSDDGYARITQIS